MSLHDGPPSVQAEDYPLVTRLEDRPANGVANDKSAPRLERAQAHPRSAEQKLYNNKTTRTILGLYMAALLCSIAHYVFFNQLHGSTASGEHTRISQSWTTFISLLLITLFKASLLGCVGICSTQYLWQVLRGQALALSTIESLFQMRHNPVNLFYRETVFSLSFLLAAYTWIVPLATIYPSGALTIISTPVVLTQAARTSVPDLVFESDFNPTLPENVSRLAEFAGIYYEIMNVGKEDVASGSVGIRTDLQVMHPRDFLNRFLKSVIAAGEIAVERPAALGENSTYILEFMGPQLSCQTVELFNHTESDNDFVDLALGKADHDPQGADDVPDNANMDQDYKWQIFQQTMLGGPCSGGHHGLFLLETHKVNCTDRYVRYNANVTFVKGIRTIHYTTQDIEPQPARDLIINMEWEADRDAVPAEEERLGEEGRKLMSEAFHASSYFQRSREYLKERFRYWNAFVIYNAFMVAIESATVRTCVKPSNLDCDVEWTMSNGSQVFFSPLECFKSNFMSTSVLENSRLNPYRFSTSREDTSRTTQVNISQVDLNELLTNITLSLMALDLWTDSVNVTTTSYRNTYEFSHKINLVLPYALCLAFGLPILTLGVWSLRSNGMPATEGFLQIMMATRGRTEMERLVLEQGTINTDAASKELRNLKVRYGELVTEDAVKEERVFGFGTVVETVETKRRKIWN